jgi:long-chain acyl-CoA synthetase
VAIVRRSGSATTPEEFQAFVADRMSAYKRLSSVEFVDEIPRTASGKVVRRKLPGVVEQARVSTKAGQVGTSS